MKSIYQGNFLDAYRASLKVRGTVEDKMNYLWRYLVSNRHLIPRRYNVLMLCGSCKHLFSPKSWDGTVYSKGGRIQFICPKCAKEARKRKRKKDMKSS